MSVKELQALTQKFADAFDQRDLQPILDMLSEDVEVFDHLATEVFLGNSKRFATANQVASYIGMIPCEHTSGKRQRLGKLTKEDNSLLRYLWTGATLTAVRKDPELKRFYPRKLIQQGMGKARIAAARKLGIRLWIMMRDQTDLRRVLPTWEVAAGRGSPCGDA